MEANELMIETENKKLRERIKHLETELEEGGFETLSTVTAV